MFFRCIALESYVLDTSSYDFAGLAEDGLFVDKSLALADFFEDRTPVHLLLRPRRSGKTTLADVSVSSITVNMINPLSLGM